MNKTGVNRNTKRQPHWNGKNPAQIPDAAPRSRTALDPVAYDNLIKQHGVRVKVYRSMYCPNVKSVDGGEHNIDCTLCNGSGFLDVDPIESVAYLANQNFQEEMTVEGYHDGNSVGGTFLGGVELQYFTRVDLMDFTQPFYERVLRRADSTEGTAGSPATPARAAHIEITFPTTISNRFAFAIYNDAFSSDGFFSVTSTPNGVVTPSQIFFGDFATGVPDGNIIEQNGEEALFTPLSTSANNPVEWVRNLVTLINSVSKDSSNQTFLTLRGSTTVGDGAGIISNCTASIGSNPRTLIITLDSSTASPNIILRPTGGVTGGVTQVLVPSPTPATPAIPSISGTNPDDNLKYDCRRVNVIIDKTGRQYHQDIDFRLTPQGNVRWIGGPNQPDAQTIYSVHYESVIQYRATSAMHVNRFAQVPDRSTGLVAQVKMPEQWMLQKEFLIIRRDEYGNEIQKTGIYGDIIANQPLNPAPADII